MGRDHYVVVQRGVKWWITIDGKSRGPFNLRKDAVEAAVQYAKISELGGNTSEVAWSDPEDGTPTVYKSD